MDRKYPLLKRRGVVLLLVAPLVLTACFFSPPPPEITDASELIGTWVVASDEVDSASIELRSDGTALLEKVPQYPLLAESGDEEHPDWSITVTTTGRWLMTNARMNGYPSVLLDVDPSEEESFEGATLSLLVDKGHSPTQVFLQYSPELHLRLNFEKEAAN